MSAPILVIEDNPANLELMMYLLHAFGYMALTATGGAEGLEIARRERPDLILCDIGMPGMSGLDVAREIRGDPALRGTLLVAVTALAMVGDREQILAAGFDGYIAKPIDPEKFVGQVESYLAKSVPGKETRPVHDPDRR